jgi:hypothetical protein
MLELSWAHSQSFDAACRDIRCLLVCVEAIAQNGKPRLAHAARILGFAVFDGENPNRCSVAIRCSDAEAQVCRSRAKDLWRSLGGTAVATPIRSITDFHVLDFVCCDGQPAEHMNCISPADASVSKPWLPA